MDNLKNIDIKTTLEDLEKFDFSSDTELDLNEYHEMIRLLNNSLVNKDKLKNSDAENLIKNDGVKFLGIEAVEKFNTYVNTLNTFLRKYEVNTDLVKKMTESEKNNIYDIAGYLFNNFQKIHNNLNFIFPLTSEEYKFILDSINTKLEYDRDGCFQVKELKDKYFINYSKFMKNEGSIEDLMTTLIDINLLMILYHHITRVKIKGVHSDFYQFISLINKMEERLVLYNAFKIITERFSEDFRLWTGALSVDDTLVNPNSNLTIVNEVTGETK
jgi:hypothetical protein